MFWGLSESLDLYQEYINSQKDMTSEPKTTNNNDKNKEDPNESKETTTEAPLSLNILIFGAGDPRHLIKTLAKLYNHRGSSSSVMPPTINFYILDCCIEIVARNIALLGIALEHPDCLNLYNKVHLFMDVYGNALMRPSTHHYLMGKAKSLMKIFTDDELLKKLCPLLSIDDLKYRERDGLENSFNFWLPKDGHVFNVQEYWLGRLKQLLGVRYDYRDGAFDWDLSMTLREREAKQICSQEYRYWRETGIAFTFPEYEQCKPNKTLSVGLVCNGEKYVHRGYVGDIQTGPFCAFGLKTSDERMLNSAHGENDYRATDITERNLLELFHELQTQMPYKHDLVNSRKYGSVKLQMGKRLSWNEASDLEAMQQYDKSWLNVEGVKVHFLSADDVFALQDTTGRWRDFFDIAFVGHNYFALIRETFVDVLRAKALLMFETKLLSLARKEAVNEFEMKLLNFAKNAKLSSVMNYNAINAKNALLKFKKNQ